MSVLGKTSLHLLTVFTSGYQSDASQIQDVLGRYRSTVDPKPAGLIHRNMDAALPENLMEVLVE